MTHRQERSHGQESAGALWRGEIYLPRTYWFYFVGGNLVLAVAGFFVERFAGLDEIDLPLSPAIIVVLFFAILNLAYYVLSAVAVWRSAGRYTGSPWWKWLARGTVIAGIIRSVLFLA